MSEIFVSVIVPAYNAQATLRACLDSLCALALPRAHMEILVVDNASRDNTRAIIEAYAPRAQYLYEKKRGPAAARNCGIMHARGEWVAFTDADCVVERAWLTALVQPLADENVGIVGGAIRALKAENEIEQFGDRINDQEKAICVYKPPYVASANWASPRHLVRAVGMFDERLGRGEDVDLAWRIFQMGKQIAYAPDAIVYHRNEATWSGLFRQGIEHGYHSVWVHRKHAAFLESYGCTRFHRASYARLAASVREYLTTRAADARCEFTFNGGKKLGKLLGSLRAGYLEL